MSGTAANINSRTSGSRIGKKKRRRLGDTISKASDKILHSRQQLADAVFPKDSYIVKVQSKKKVQAKNNAVQDQFEDAPEFAEKQLRQNRTDSFGAKPPFGYFSLHPSTLMLHPPHATYWYYPTNPPWMRPPPPPPNAIQPQFHQQHHPNFDSIIKGPSRSVSQPGIASMSPHQQIHTAQQKEFLDFSRRNRQQEQTRQQEVYKQSHQHEQQQRNQQREKYSQLQQKECTAVVLAGMRAQPTTTSTQAAATAAHSAKVKTMPVGHTALTGERLVAENNAAKYLGHLSSVSSVATQQQRRPPPPPVHQEQPKSTNEPTRHQQKPLVPAAGSSEDASLDENGAGARQFIKRMIITTTEESPLTTGMDKLETLPMLPYTPPDSKNPVRETEITNCDVLLGRGGMTNHHVGNMHFRTLVSSFRLHYCAAKKGDKGRLSKKLTNFVRHKKGRFLQKDEANNLWYEVGDNRANGKCAQALREGTADLNRQVASGSVADTNAANPIISACRMSYAVRTTSAPVSFNGISNTMSYTCEADVIPRHNHGGMMPTATLPAPHQQLSDALRDHSSPLCVIGHIDSGAPSSIQSRPGPSAVEERARAPAKRPFSKTNSNGHPRKAAVSIQGARPTATGDDKEFGNVERPISRKSSSAKSDDSGDRYDDEESTQDEHLATEEEARRKRVKVRHNAEDNFEYI